MFSSGKNEPPARTVALTLALFSSFEATPTRVEANDREDDAIPPRIELAAGRNSDLSDIVLLKNKECIRDLSKFHLCEMRKQNFDTEMSVSWQ